MRAVALLLVLPLLSGCTGEREQRAASTSARGRAAVSAKPSPHFSPPAVMLFVGLNAEKGILSATCDDGRCRTLTTARPKRYLEGVASGLVSFTTGRPPKAARLLVHRDTRAGRAAEPQHDLSLRPGTMMSATITVRPGRYRLTLIGTWGSREARWTFGLQGPSGR